MVVGGEGASGGCCAPDTAACRNPPAFAAAYLPRHHSHHHASVLVARCKRCKVVWGWLCGRAVRPLAHPWHGMPPQPAGRLQHHAVDPVADSPCVCCVTMAGGWVHCHHGMWLNTPLNRRGGGPAGIRPCSCRGGGLAIDVIIHPCSLPVCMPWGVGGVVGGAGGLSRMGPHQGV